MKLRSAGQKQQQHQEKEMANVSTTTSLNSSHRPIGEQGKPKQETSGRITFKLDNFTAFAQEENDDSRWSDPVNIQGIQWRIEAYITTRENGTKYLSFYVLKDKKAPNCRAMVKYRLISVKDGIENYVLVLRSALDFGTGDDMSTWGYRSFKNIQKLLDPANGWLQNDTITLEAEVFADRPLAKKPTPDILIVNGLQINVDKYQLATHSEYFRGRFFGEGVWADNANAIGVTRNVEIGEAVSSVDDFKMMIECTYPEPPPLNDDCIEGVLNVANQFFVDRVEGICVQFLLQKSEKCAMFKYRMGTKYGLGALKEIALMELNNPQLSGGKLVEHHKEFKKMSVQAQDEFNELLAERVQAPAAKRARLG